MHFQALGRSGVFLLPLLAQASVIRNRSPGNLVARSDESFPQPVARDIKPVAKRQTTAASADPCSDFTKTTTSTKFSTPSGATISQSVSPTTITTTARSTTTVTVSSAFSGVITTTITQSATITDISTSDSRSTVFENATTTTTLPPATITDFAAQELSRLRKRQSQGQVAATPEVFTSSDGNVCTVGERIVGRFGTNVCTLTTVTATTTAAAGASTATITVTSLETSTLNLATVLTNGVTSVASTTRTVETFTTVPTTTRGTTTLTGTTTSTRTTVETETPPPVNVTLREFTLTSSCVDENCTGDGLYLDAQGPGETVDFIPTIGSRFAIQGSALTALDSDPENMVLYVDTGAEAAPVRSALSDSIQDNDGSPLNCNFDNATGIIGCSAAGNAIQWWNCDGTLWIDPVGEAPAEAQNCQNIQLNVQSPNSTNSTEPPDNGGGNGGNGTTTPPDNGGDGSSATGFSIMIGCQSDSNCINSGQYVNVVAGDPATSTIQATKQTYFEITGNETLTPTNGPAAGLLASVFQENLAVEWATAEEIQAGGYRVGCSLAESGAGSILSCRLAIDYYDGGPPEYQDTDTYSCLEDPKFVLAQPGTPLTGCDAVDLVVEQAAQGNGTNGTDTGGDGTGTTTPPDDGGSTTPPDDGGSTTPPDDGGSTTPPDDGGSTTPPDDGGSTTPPDDGGSTTPPDDGGSTTPPDDGGSTTTPDDGGSTTPPDDGGSTTPPDDGGSTTPPDDGGSTTPPDDGGSTTPPDESGSTTPPDDGGSTTPPDDGGSTTPPDDGGSTTPHDDGSSAQDPEP